MSEIIINWISLLVGIVLIPPFLMGTIQKIKARLQNRIGAPLVQPYIDLIKLFGKDETVSKTVSWIFRSSTVINFVLMIILAAFLPWLSAKPIFAGDDLFLVLYLMTAAKLLSILSALDAASPFGAFASSREATLTLLVEPSCMLSLIALGILKHSSSLSTIFSFACVQPNDTIVWLLASLAIAISSLVEMSRMPIDDSTTHLELTMVHEAMIIEASGRNLALLEYTQALKLSIFLGLVCQCLLHALASIILPQTQILFFVSFLGLVVLAIALGIFEAVSVKLQWRKIPEFIAYSLTMSFLACLVSISGGSTP